MRVRPVGREHRVERKGDEQRDEYGAGDRERKGLEQLTRDALLFGNGYASISRDDDGNPVELHHMRPEQVAVYINTTTLEPSYQNTPLDGAMVALNTPLKNGQRYQNTYLSLFVIRDGRVAAVREYCDTGYARKTLRG